VFLDLGIEVRSALVTGGSQGIGRATARRLLLEGVRVAITARDAERLKKTRDELAEETGGQVFAIGADAATPAGIEQSVRAAASEFGTIDILVNNAGTMYSGRFDVMTEEGLKEQLETKLFGWMRAIRLVYPMMKERGWGRIVNIMGGAGKEPDPYMFGSGITNSALLNVTKSLSTEFAPYGVTVNGACPGWVDTGLWRRNAEGLKKEVGADTEEEARKLATRKNAMGRFGKPEDLADTVAFLVSERANYITGVSVNVDGGRLKGLF
jgi:3-oxoacyl-[acyl-carrier protein] reductase